MNTTSAKKTRPQAHDMAHEKPAPDLTACGRVSEQTRGLPSLPLFELGTPPYDRIYVGEDELS